MSKMLHFDRLRSILVATVTQLPDRRTRPNTKYEMADAALGAFAVFFMQSPSFLAHQRDMQRRKGQNNAASLFGLDEVPSDPQIRNLLDPVAPEHLAAPSGRCSSTCGRAITSRRIRATWGRGCAPWMARSTSARRRFTVRNAARGSSTGAPTTRTAWWRR